MKQTERTSTGSPFLTMYRLFWEIGCNINGMKNVFSDHKLSLLKLKNLKIYFEVSICFGYQIPYA